MLPSHRIAAVLASGLVMALTLTGCGGFGLGGDEQKATLVAAQNSELGLLVTDSKGMTLYRSDKDSARPPKSSCVDECTTTWIPVTVAEGATVQGVDPQLVGVIKRPDGATQITLAGWPLYRFLKDKKAGQVKGQGIAKTWWVVAPDGTKIRPGGEQDGQDGPQGGQTGTPDTGGQSEPPAGEGPAGEGQSAAPGGGQDGTGTEGGTTPAGGSVNG